MSRKSAKIETAADLQAMSKAELADAYGPLAAAAKPLEKRLETFKAEFERRGLSLLIGKTFTVQKSEASFDQVDVAKAKAELGAAWCEANKKKVTRTSWKVNRPTDADKADAPGAEAAA